ncbi:MAG: recombinase RecA [Patescibacteria group bacterium]
MAKQITKEVETDARSRAALDAIAQIKQRFGEGAIMRLGEATTMQVEAVSTGCLSLDLALGVMGVPRGRIIEIYGPESSGKSTLAQHIVAEVQKTGGLAAYVDAEHALDPEYAQKLGVNIDELFISQPDTGEQALEIVETLVRSNAVDVIVIDSVAALTPRAEIEGDMGDSHMGLQARLMSQALRKLAAIVSKSKTTVVFINQIRMKIGVVFGNPETTPGGNALKFYASIRIEIRRAAQIKQGEQIIGNRTKAKIVKNKVAPPFRSCEFDIMYNEGISISGDLIDQGVAFGVIQKSGSNYYYKEEKLGLGREASKATLKGNPLLMTEIREAIVKAIKGAHDEDPGEVIQEEVKQEQPEGTG